MACTPVHRFVLYTAISVGVDAAGTGVRHILSSLHDGPCAAEADRIH